MRDLRKDRSGNSRASWGGEWLSWIVKIQKAGERQTRFSYMRSSPLSLTGNCPNFHAADRGKQFQKVENKARAIYPATLS